MYKLLIIVSSVLLSGCVSDQPETYFAQGNVYPVGVYGRPTPPIYNNVLTPYRNQNYHPEYVNSPTRYSSTRTSYSKKRTSYSSSRRSYSSRSYHIGPRGGCYYINSRGNKTYVDRSLCR